MEQKPTLSEKDVDRELVRLDSVEIQTEEVKSQLQWLNEMKRYYFLERRKQIPYPKYKGD